MDAASMSQLQKQLILHEGCKLTAYRDSVGVITIGIGRNLQHRGITQEEALMLLRNDISATLTAMRKELPWTIALDDVRQRVLCDMAFNMGVGQLLEFKRTLAAVKAGDYEAAADMMLDSRWASQVGERARRLARMMRTGKDEIR
jgi:lysozyme